MIRSVAVIVWAILQSQPSMSEKQAEAYATIVQEEAKKRHFDPFTLVSIVHSESRWRAGVISRDGEDYGLGQIRARYVGGCRNDPDPINQPSDSCKRTKAMLLSGAYNLRRSAASITEWRKTCRKITGRPALFKRWLHGYGGMGKRDKTNKRWIRICGQRPTKKGWRDLPVHHLLKRIINRRKRLIRGMPRRRR